LLGISGASGSQLIAEFFGFSAARDALHKMGLKPAATFSSSGSELEYALRPWMGPKDLALMRKAAEKLWPGMPITNSTLLLTLARLKAQEVLRTTPSKVAFW